MRDAKFVTIGFDVREVVPTSAIRRLDQLNQMVAWPSKVLTTADAMVQPKPPRYRYQENSSDAETSILGFFRPIGGLIRSVRADISGTEKIYVYRLRSEIVAYIEERFGCIEREFDLATDASEFQQIGFDVVDIDGLTSGLWGCSFEIWEKNFGLLIFRSTSTGLDCLMMRILQRGSRNAEVWWLKNMRPFYLCKFWLCPIRAKPIDLHPGLRVGRARAL